MRAASTANGGWETFRARGPHARHLVDSFVCGGAEEPRARRPRNCAEGVRMVRELHVGTCSAVAVHDRERGKFQHQGYGTLLMREAVKFTARDEHRSKKLAVISEWAPDTITVSSVRELEGPHMVKRL